MSDMMLHLALGKNYIGNIVMFQLFLSSVAQNQGYFHFLYCPASEVGIRGKKKLRGDRTRDVQRDMP